MILRVCIYEESKVNALAVLDKWQLMVRRVEVEPCEQSRCPWFSDELNADSSPGIVDIAIQLLKSEGEKTPVMLPITDLACHLATFSRDPETSNETRQLISV